MFKNRLDKYLSTLLDDPTLAYNDNSVDARICETRRRLQRMGTIGNTRVSVAYYSFYDNIQLYEQNESGMNNVMKVTAMEYNLWSYQ